MANKERSIQVPSIDVDLQTIEVPIKAIKGSTLLLNKMRDKERQNMLDKVTGKSVDKNKIRDLDQETKEKIWYTDDGQVGFPASGFKLALVEAAPNTDSISKKLANSIQVMGNIIPLKYAKLTTNKAITYDSGITKAPRETWRPELHEWSCKLTICFNAKLMTAEQIVGLIRLAGFHIGIGSWRPYTKKTGGGSHGMFSVDTR